MFVVNAMNILVDLLITDIKKIYIEQRSMKNISKVTFPYKRMSFHQPQI